MSNLKKNYLNKIIIAVLIACSIIFSFFIGTSFHRADATYGNWKDTSLASNYTLNDTDGDGYLELSNTNDFVCWYKNYNTYSRNKLELTANVNMTEKYWTPIPLFAGEFNGNGYQISSLYIHRSELNADNEKSQMSGLISYLSNTSVIKNLNIAGGLSSGSSSGTSKGHTTCGGGGLIAGINYGTIENCFFSSSLINGKNNISGLKIVDSWDSPDINAAYFGGLVGINKGTIKNCIDKNGGSLYLVPQTLSDDIQSLYVGGIAGKSSGTIENCMVRSTVVVALNTYSPKVHAYAGGIVGNLVGGTISHCAYYPPLDNGMCIYAFWAEYNAVIGGIVGKSEKSSKNSIIQYCHNSLKKISIFESGAKHEDKQNIKLKNIPTNSSFSNTITTPYTNHYVANTTLSNWQSNAGHYKGKFDFTNATYTLWLANRYAAGIVGMAENTTITNCYSEVEEIDITSSYASYTNIKFQLLNPSGTVITDDLLGISQSSWYNMGDICSSVGQNVSFSNCFAAESSHDNHISFDFSYAPNTTLTIVYKSGSTYTKSSKHITFTAGRWEYGSNPDLLFAMWAEYSGSYGAISRDRIISGIDLDVRPNKRTETSPSTTISNLTKNHSDNWVINPKNNTPTLRCFYWEYSTQEPTKK